VLTRAAAALVVAALAACDADSGPATELSSARSSEEIGVTTHRVRNLATETATSATERPVEGRVLEIEGSRDVVVPRGNLFRVELLANAGTGHAWRVEMPGVSPLEQVGEPVTRPVDRGVMGGRVQWQFTFRPVGSGSCDLVFNLVRPWESGVAPAKTATLHVTVQ
jgi:predicted secreted protein